MVLRDYQADAEFKIKQAWLFLRYVLAVLPTGAGKTVVFSKILKDHNGPACAIAHRQELVSQISEALAKFGVVHNIIADKKVVHEIIKVHIKKFGKNFYSPISQVAVAGVKTLLNRAESLKKWMKSVTLWVTDEAHHVLKDNEWGRACALFPNAKGLGVTATPMRADGCGLGFYADSIFEHLVEGVTMRELINRGYLTDYVVYAPPSDLDLEGVKISDKTGEYSPKQLKARAQKSHIVGDVVKSYLRFAPGKLGVTFAIDVEEATKIAKCFNDAGTPAAVITGNTGIAERIKILQDFKDRKILQLVNVDLFGEGFDLPAIECVSFARPTMSYSLYVQQFGRVLRLMVSPELRDIWDQLTDEQRVHYIKTSSKPRAIIIDHVGNVMRHLLPDKLCKWSLDRREKASRKKRDPDDIPLKNCTTCLVDYEAIYKICPECGAHDVPEKRSKPSQVNGDLIELSDEALAKLRGEINKVDGPAYAPMGSTKIVANSISKNHRLRQEAQKSLREAIRWFGGYHQYLGIDTSESHRRFYFRFNIDVMTAQTLNKRDANELEGRINKYLQSVQ